MLAKHLNELLRRQMWKAFLDTVGRSDRIYTRRGVAYTSRHVEPDDVLALLQPLPLLDALNSSPGLRSAQPRRIVSVFSCARYCRVVIEKLISRI